MPPSNSSPRSRRATLRLFVFAFFSGIGCAHHPPVAPGVRFAVQVSKAAFYKNGPAQMTGPDLYLDRAQRVTVLKTELGYSQVMIDDGTEGYVAARQLRPAPPEPALAKTSPTKRPFPTGPPRPAVEPDLPALDLSDSPLLPR